jgi:Domain of unknown function (DUF5071)
MSNGKKAKCFKMKYKLSLEAISDYTQMSILAGELYIIDENEVKSHVCKMVLENYFFIENDTKIVIPTLKNIENDGVNNWCMQIAIADLSTQKIHFYNKYFANNGEKITYENSIITVHNENNEFVKTDFLDISRTEVKVTENFEVLFKKHHYYKRHWTENRGDKHNDWGTSWWYFETDGEGNILKQIEEYENGTVQCYDTENPENEFGGLGKTPMELWEFAEYEIYKEDFDSIWNINYKIIKNDLYTHLRQISTRPAMYLGENTITALWHYVSGYQSACYFKGAEEDLSPRWSLFHEFVKRKTNFAESTGGWKYMILAFCEGNEEKALDTFFKFFEDFLKGEELNVYLQNLIPKDKHDWDLEKAMDIHWYNYAELKPIIPQLLIWLQDINWPVAKPISALLKPMLPDILTELIPILQSEDGVWKYNILQVFFIETKTSYWNNIASLIIDLAKNPSEIDKKEEVDILALEIINNETLI